VTNPVVEKDRALADALDQFHEKHPYVFGNVSISSDFLPEALPSNIATTELLPPPEGFVPCEDKKSLCSLYYLNKKEHKGMCRLCGEQIAYSSSSTGSLGRHLDGKHVEVRADFDRIKTNGGDLGEFVSSKILRDGKKVLQPTKSFFMRCMDSARFSIFLKQLLILAACITGNVAFEFVGNDYLQY
jgi:hypothetical protein